MQGYFDQIPIREYQKLHGSTLVGSRLQWCSEHGSKIDEIIKLVRSIVNEKKEKVLIFAQWSESTDNLQKEPALWFNNSGQNLVLQRSHESTPRQLYNYDNISWSPSRKFKQLPQLGGLEVSKQLGKDISQGKARHHEDDWQQFYRKEGTDTRKFKPSWLSQF
jgi:hypothetical protein